MASRSSAPKRVPNPGSRASMREPAPSTTTDSARPADRQDRAVLLDGGACADADVVFAIGLESLQLDVEHVESRRQGREAQLPILGRDGSRPANQRRRADADHCTRRTPPCASLTVPMRAPVRPCAAAICGSTRQAMARPWASILQSLARRVHFVIAVPPVSKAATGRENLNTGRLSTETGDEPRFGDYHLRARVTHFREIRRRRRRWEMW